MAAKLRKRRKVAISVARDDFFCGKCLAAMKKNNVKFWLLLQETKKGVLVRKWVGFCSSEHREYFKTHKGAAYHVLSENRSRTSSAFSGLLL